MRLPVRIERDYAASIMLGIVDEWIRATEKTLFPKLPEIERQVSQERPGGIRSDSWSDDLSSVLEKLTLEYDKVASQSRDIAAGVFDKVNHVTHEQWYKAANKVMGVNLFQFEPWIKTEATAFIKENVDLITKVESDVLSDISRITMGGFRQGKRWESVKDEIMSGTDLVKGPFKKLETRAELIARDQSLKLYSDLGEKRQRSTGLVWYVWRSMEDERVVGTPGGKWPEPTDGHGNHFFMNGKVCRWDDSTVYADSIDDAKNGKWKQRPEKSSGEVPGRSYNCRCYAEPVFDTLFM
jgi:uncharacterized protein with gpF-like domain